MSVRFSARSNLPFSGVINILFITIYSWLSSNGRTQRLCHCNNTDLDRFPGLGFKSIISTEIWSSEVLNVFSITQIFTNSFTSNYWKYLKAHSKFWYNIWQLKPFKNDEKRFWFHVKTSLRSQDIKVFVLMFWSCRKTAWLERKV